MSLQRVTKRHKLRWFRVRVVSGLGGGKTNETIELGTVYGTVNPDSDLEISEFETRNEQVTASIYFSSDPGCLTLDFYQIIGIMVGGAYAPVANGDTYRVESVLNFQSQDRLWRVRATKRASLSQ